MAPRAKRGEGPRTKYSVLRWQGHMAAYVWLGDVEAPTALAAVKELAGDTQGHYAAVPARFLRWIPVESQTVTTTTIGESIEPAHEAFPLVVPAEVPCANPECEHDVTLHMAAGSCQACDCTQYVGRQEPAVDVPDINPDDIPF